MAETEGSVRQSVSIPTGIARRVRALAKKERFLLLANRLTESPDSAERQRLKEELARRREVETRDGGVFRKYRTRLARQVRVLIGEQARS